MIKTKMIKTKMIKTKTKKQYFIEQTEGKVKYNKETVMLDYIEYKLRSGDKRYTNVLKMKEDLQCAAWHMLYELDFIQHI